MTLTLRHKINGAIITTILLIVIVFIAVQIPYHQHRLQAEVDKIEILLQTLVERDEEQLANELFDNRLQAIQIRIRQMTEVPGILGITVYDQNGQRLKSHGGKFGEQAMAAAEIERIGRSPQLDMTEQSGKPMLVYSKRIEFLGERLGFIRLSYSMQSVMDDRRTSFLIDLGMLATILLTMLIVLNLLLSRSILRPVMTLRDATQDIVKGNLDNAIDTKRGDELGNLAESFDMMRNAIRDQISDLERMTGIIDSTSDLVAIGTPDIRLIYLNQAGRRMLGWPESHAMSGQPMSAVHPEWTLKKLTEIAIPAAIENGTWEGEVALIGADGREIPVSQVIISHKNASGHLEFISTIMRDISLQKATEDELRYLRNYLANIINSMPSVLIGVDRDGTVTQWNAEAERTTKIPASKAQGQPLTAVFPRLSSDMDRLNEAMQNRRMVTVSKQPYQLEGSTGYEDVTIYPLIRNELEGAVIRIDDVTEKIRLEEMMIQNEKMLSVGGLAAGMAHEINNPLAGMIQAASVLSGRLMDDSIRANREVATAQGLSMEAIRRYMEARDVPNMLNRIRESGRRASEIVTNMLSFARKSDESLSPHSLAELLDKTTDLAGSDYDLKKKFDFRQISISREYDPDVPDVPCEPGKIQQVLLNILRNGAEAMKESETQDQPPRFIYRLSYEASNRMVQLEIEDNGPGMDEETRKRIFEPFFTTKPTGSGTGLGLSVSYFIITENHGGTMSVQSMRGQGTRFIIRLPVKG